VAVEHEKGKQEQQERNQQEEERGQEQPTSVGASGADEGAGEDRNTAGNGESPAKSTEESESSPALFAGTERDTLSQRWSEIQADFVDQPQRSLEQANELVSDLMERLVGSFRSEQARLEGQWEQGEQVSTDDLRLTLQRYRSFFRRLLEV
jgi:hypothetical protein